MPTWQSKIATVDPALVYVLGVLGSEHGQFKFENAWKIQLKRIPLKYFLHDSVED
jgi:hypothetical protein